MTDKSEQYRLIQLSIEKIVRLETRSTKLFTAQNLVSREIAHDIQALRESTSADIRLEKSRLDDMINDLLDRAYD